MHVPIVKSILTSNDQIAAENKAVLDQHGVVAVNLMASPGAGKTSLILATARSLPAALRPAVIEGDLASSIDAELMAKNGIPVVQINTGGNCHLDAPMIRSAFPHLPFGEFELLLIENVGNLVCPANFALGAHLALVVASVPEGHDKPYKYPGMFAAADVVVLNKVELKEVFEFDPDYFWRGVQMLKPEAPIFEVSCRTGAGVAEWAAWLAQHVAGVATQNT
ncbi:MAG: hydrogenase nickel incorporation protein HypB [Chloroflexaceae bacterium]|nr:hydrogenase nickel incorporation protein HypB [Chloroflexaceae bacterium]